MVTSIDLRPDPVTEVPEHETAHWPGDQADTESVERRQTSCERAELWEKQLRKDQGSGCSVYKEVVPLNRRPYEASERDAPYRCDLFGPVQDSKVGNGLAGHGCPVLTSSVSARILRRSLRSP